MKFAKYHALGNDYLVVNPADLDRELSKSTISVLCDRNYGVGSDGLLYGPLPSDTSDFKLRIFNPDGSEAEKSGNGLRIFSRYLWDQEQVTTEPFTIETSGGEVIATVLDSGTLVSVAMGQVRFTHGADSPTAPIEESITVGDSTFRFFRTSVGNPHCVIPVDDLSSSLAHNYGALIEYDSRFQHRTNVQFLKILSRDTIQIEIWERGAGYTLASGSSSTAAAAVAHALGHCDSTVEVHMPGGELTISLAADYQATMTGPVVKIAEGILASEAFSI